MFDKILQWVVVSSANPEKISLSVKMALLGIIPFVMQAIGIACGLGVVCVDVEMGMLEESARAVGDVVFYMLSLISSVGFLYGAGRKVWRTITGTNEALDV